MSVVLYQIYKHKPKAFKTLSLTRLNHSVLNAALPALSLRWGVGVCGETSTTTTRRPHTHHIPIRWALERNH